MGARELGDLNLMLILGGVFEKNTTDEPLSSHMLNSLKFSAEIFLKSFIITLCVMVFNSI